MISAWIVAGILIMNTLFIYYVWKENEKFIKSLMEGYIILINKTVEKKDE